MSTPQAIDNENLLDFLNSFVGYYEPNTYEYTTVDYNISTGAILGETTNTIIPNGIGAVDFNYITRFIMLLLIVIVLYRTIKLSFNLFLTASNPRSRNVKLK